MLSTRIEAEKEGVQMIEERDKMNLLLGNNLGITCEKADQLLTFLAEQEYLMLASNQSCGNRFVFLDQAKSDTKAVSYKPQNLVFHFKKAALSDVGSVIETYLGADALLNGKKAVLYIFLICLKTFSNMKVVISSLDAELIAFLWDERLHKRLNVDDEFEAFKYYMDKCGKAVPSDFDYHQSLDRLVSMNVLEITDGMIILREKVVVR